MTIAIRPYLARDLGEILQLWERTGSLPQGADGLSVDQAVDLLTSERSIAVVAEDDRGLLGMGLGAASGVVGWILRIVTLRDAPATGVIHDLVEAIESRLAEDGVRHIFIVAANEASAMDEMRACGYDEAAGALLEKEVPGSIVAPSRLTELGGRMLDPGLWDELKGIDEAKEIIERRVILPLANPELAARHAVAPPRAVVLFGPPGTGKTTFAKGIASRLEWPFIEIQPSELAGEGAERQAKVLAGTFDRILDLPSAVVFADEVEDLASMRTEDRKVNPSVTNEFLKQIPRLRDVPHHLLVCATNWIARLDPAFMRPGRFDYVLPVGPPDADAREAIWARYVGDITDEQVRLDALVDASELFTPADIEFAARKAAQRAFEQEVFEGTSSRATTEDFLWAIERTRPTLSKEIVDGFNKEARRFGRY